MGNIRTFGDATIINTTKSSGIDIFSDDISMADGGEFHYWEIFIELSKETILTYTRNGTLYKKFSNKTLQKDTGYTFYIPANKDDSFNIKADGGNNIIFTGTLRGLKEFIPHIPLGVEGIPTKSTQFKTDSILKEILQTLVIIKQQQELITGEKIR